MLLAVVLLFCNACIFCSSQSIGPRCKASKYRTIDGSCNNLEKTWLGQTSTPFNRILPVGYEDGISIPKRGLPSARKIRTTIFKEFDTVNPQLSTLFMSFAQLVTHDLASSVFPPINCCGDQGNSSSAFVDVCIPIPVPNDDPFFSKFGVDCLNMVRHKNTRQLGSTDGPADQINEVTHYIDGSQIYGSSSQTEKRLRTFTGGKLKVSLINGRPFLPTGQERFCRVDSINKFCYKAGDSRVNQNPVLTALTVAAHRHHNRIADVLADINPHWRDETLYQEARKIVVASLQHIFYNDLLPILLGQQTINERGIKNEGEFSKYDPNVDPRVLNEFTTATFRYLHAIIRGQTQLSDTSGQTYLTVNISSVMNFPQFMVDNGNYNGLLFGSMCQHMGEPSRFINSEITNKIFQPRNGNFGTDLIAIDIQRTRDHGLPNYVTAQSVLFGREINSFSDFETFISRSNVNLLRRAYRNPQDVELLVAANLENHIQNSILGPTNSLIATEQFFRSKYGDRYWYEHEGVFTSDQLAEIKKISIGRIICDNADSVTRVFRNPFIVSSNTNRLISCEDVPNIDYTKWMER